MSWPERRSTLGRERERSEGEERGSVCVCMCVCGGEGKRVHAEEVGYDVVVT